MVSLNSVIYSGIATFTPHKNNVLVSNYHWALLALVSLFLACGEQQTPETTIQEEETAADSVYDGAVYHHYQGTIGDLPVTVHLISQTGAYGVPVNTYSGYYYYDRYQHPIALFGQAGEEDPGQLRLEEPSTPDGENPYWIGGLPGPDGFSGQWIDPDSGRELSFELRPANPAGIAFKSYILQDSLRYYPDRDNSPVAYFAANWMEAASGNGAVDDWLNQQIRIGLVGDSLARQHSTVGEAIRAYRDNYFSSYREEVELMLADGVVDTVDFFGLNYDESLRMDVLFNTDSLLTLGYTYYYFSGGAHGNYGTTLQSYQPADRRIFDLNSVFTGNYAKALADPLAEGVRQRYELAEGQSLTEVLFEEVVEPTENFGLTGKGILFNYPPYAIGPYALGEVMVFVPFERVLEYVQSPFRPEEE